MKSKKKRKAYLILVTEKQYFRAVEVTNDLKEIKAKEKEGFKDEKEND